MIFVADAKVGVETLIGRPLIGLGDGRYSDGDGDGALSRPVLKSCGSSRSSKGSATDSSKPGSFLMIGSMDPMVMKRQPPRLDRLQLHRNVEERMIAVPCALDRVMMRHEAQTLQ